MGREEKIRQERKSMKDKVRVRFCGVEKQLRKKDQNRDIVRTTKKERNRLRQREKQIVRQIFRKRERKMLIKKKDSQRGKESEGGKKKERQKKRECLSVLM